MLLEAPNVLKADSDTLLERCPKYEGKDGRGSWEKRKRTTEHGVSTKSGKGTNENRVRHEARNSL